MCFDAAIEVRHLTLLEACRNGTVPESALPPSYWQLSALARNTDSDGAGLSSVDFRWRLGGSFEVGPLAQKLVVIILLAVHPLYSS